MQMKWTSVFVIICVIGCVTAQQSELATEESEKPATPASIPIFTPKTVENEVSENEESTVSSVPTHKTASLPIMNHFNNIGTHIQQQIANLHQQHARIAQLPTVAEGTNTVRAHHQATLPMIDIPQHVQQQIRQIGRQLSVPNMFQQAVQGAQFQPQAVQQQQQQQQQLQQVPQQYQPQQVQQTQQIPQQQVFLQQLPQQVQQVQIPQSVQQQFQPQQQVQQQFAGQQQVPQQQFQQSIPFQQQQQPQVQQQVVNPLPPINHNVLQQVVTDHEKLMEQKPFIPPTHFLDTVPKASTNSLLSRAMYTLEQQLKGEFHAELKHLMNTHTGVPLSIAVHALRNEFRKRYEQSCVQLQEMVLKKIDQHVVQRSQNYRNTVDETEPAENHDATVADMHSKLTRVTARFQPFPAVVPKPDEGVEENTTETDVAAAEGETEKPSAKATETNAENETSETDSNEETTSAQPSGTSATATTSEDETGSETTSSDATPATTTAATDSSNEVSEVSESDSTDAKSDTGDKKDEDETSSESESTTTTTTNTAGPVQTGDEQTSDTVTESESADPRARIRAANMRRQREAQQQE